MTRASGSRSLGTAAERAAAADLERRGARILARNTRVGGVELDLVARLGEQVWIVEVKGARAPALPEQNLKPAQHRRLAAAARLLVGRLRLPVELVLAAVAFPPAGGTPEIRWFRLGAPPP